MKYDFNIDCTGDAVTGDIIQFSENVWAGSFRNPKKIGERVITAEIINDNYGTKKQQHTFTLIIINCEGTNSIKSGIKTTRKGRNIYRNGTKRILWNDEENRKKVVQEKHNRGSKARRDRDCRRNYELQF